MKRIKPVAVLLTVLSCTACFSQEKKLEPNQFEKKLKDKEVQLLDVRTATEYRSGHLPNSLQADWKNKDEFSERTLSLNKSKPVYVYCAAGARSEAAAAWLRKKGFQQVVELEGGYNKWKQHNKVIAVSPAIKDISIHDYNNQVKQYDKVLVVFCSTYLPACKNIASVVQDVTASGNNRYSILQLNADDYAKVRQQINATGLPTYIVYQQGKEIWRKAGAVTADELKKAISNK